MKSVCEGLVYNYHASIIEKPNQNSIKTKTGFLFKFKNHIETIKPNHILRKSVFLSLKVKLSIIKLSQAIIKVTILAYFKYNWYIWFKTNASKYIIRVIFVC